MARVLVVHHDGDMADQEADWLRQDGHTVVECAGPSYAPCPILHGRPCDAVAHADVLVYDTWATGDSVSEQELIERMREQHPGTPIVLTSPGLEFDWVEVHGEHAVVPITGALNAAALKGAVARALETVSR